ncbi:MAG: HEAT repeat domain-containing protein [Planctomycetota bacterium]|nr:HEAT repeat domain-containing protein [Planctomycetota bacterium]
MMFRALVLSLALLAPLSFSPTPTGANAPADVATIVAELKKNRDEGDPKLIAELGVARTREAALALIDLYDTAFGSIYMRREVVKALGNFDGVGDAEQPALQRLTDVATTSEEPELRAMELATLGNCTHLGKHFLKTIVESAAQDDVRERAMERLVRMASAEDKEFFERVFNGPTAAAAGKEKDKGKKDKDGEPARAVHSVKSIRELAFEQVAQGLALPRLYELAREKERDNVTELWGIRKLSLLEIERRGDKGLRDLAETIYDDKTERDAVRVEAIRILVAAEGAKLAARLVDEGRGNEDVMPELLREALADHIAALRDDATDKKLVKMLGKGKLHEQRFVLRALKGYRDEKLMKSLAKEVLDGIKKAPPKANDPEYNAQRDLVLATIAMLGASGDKAIEPELSTVLRTGKDPLVLSAAVDALTTLRKGDPAWTKELETLAGGTEVEVRNAALMQLGKLCDKKHVPILAAALGSDDWSTRYAALDGLVALRAPESAGALVEAMQKESGLMLARYAEALWKLSGKPFRTSAQAWKAWWDKEGAGFQPVSLADLAKLETEEEMRRLKATTKTAQFFGIRILSHRVVFIIDVSGSMNEMLRSEYVGKQGKPRIEVAKTELQRCIDSLEPESLFNILVFSSDVDSWLDGGLTQSGTTGREAAKKFVGTLGAAGGTNLYDAMRTAFTDKDVDTIIVLSDGEPSVGEITDPQVIRQRVALWNQHRRIVIHTVAVGGTHRKFQ